MSYLKKVLDPIWGGAEDVYHYDPDEDRESEYSDRQNELGAPVEHESPLGYNLDYVTAFYTVVQGIIGTGIFATPGSVFKSMGSIGSTYVLWVSGFIISLFEVLVYIEFVTYFRKRSGGDVIYLEQAYSKGSDFLVPTTYAAVSVLLSFLTSSAIAFGTYILNAAEAESSAWAQRGVGLAALTLACILSALSTRVSLKLSNFLGFVKVVFLIFVAITGLVVLGGGTRVKDSHAIFKNAWEGTTTNGNAISNAILKVSFSYGGTQYVFSLVGESNPRTNKNLFRIFIPSVMFFIFILYLLVITAYYAGISDIKELTHSGTLIASLFFQKTFGTKAASKALDVLVALSAFGHLLAAIVGHSRALRECGRQGVLPYSKLWASTKPFGTPLLAIIVTWVVNLIVCLAPPPGDAYNFVVDLGSYSGYFFKLLLVIGLLLVRKQRKKAGLGFVGFKVPLPILILTILYELFVLVMAFVPPANGSLKGSDVSFFYCTYALTVFGILALCFAYYFVWANVLPRIYKYQHRTLYFTLENGEAGHTVVKVPYDEVAQWDAEHDANGRELTEDHSSIEDITVLITDNNAKLLKS